MLNDEEAHAVCAEWQAMTQQEKEVLLKRLEVMRSNAQAAQPFISFPLETWRTQSEEVCYDMWESAYQETDGAAPAIELATLQKLLFSPRVAAREKAARYLKSGLENPDFNGYPELRILFETALNAVIETSDGDGSNIDYFLATPAVLAEAVTRAARIAAMSKNQEPRSWVFQEWQARSNRNMSKRQFAEKYVPLVYEKFNKRVSADRIERYWLPKGPPA